MSPRMEQTVQSWRTKSCVCNSNERYIIIEPTWSEKIKGLFQLCWLGKCLLHLLNKECSSHFSSLVRLFLQGAHYWFCYILKMGLKEKSFERDGLYLPMWTLHLNHKNLFREHFITQSVFIYVISFNLHEEHVIEKTCKGREWTSCESAPRNKGKYSSQAMGQSTDENFSQVVSFKYHKRPVRWATYLYLTRVS